MSPQFLKVLHRFIPLMITLSILGSSLPMAPLFAQGEDGNELPTQDLYLPAVQSQSVTALGDLSSEPNIVFILMDDLDLELMQHFPGLKSLLADKGTTFRNAFVSTPLCCVSRATILRGQYAHNSGVRDNHTEYQGAYSTFYQLGLENSTFATWLQGQGYVTAFMGKHLNNYPDYAPSSTYVPPGWDEWYAAYNGNMYNQFNYALNENGVRVPYGSDSEDYLGDVLANKALDFIRRQSGGDSPFLVYISPTTPHEPSAPPPRHLSAFPGVKAPRPPSFNEADISDKPAWLRSNALLDTAAIDRIDTLYRKQLQAMLAVEEMVQRLIDTLNATGELDNTYLFFASDNGFHRGEHRQSPGKGTPYEEDIRVPFIVRGPGVPEGRVLDHIVMNTDFAPTFAELAGAPIPSFVDGRSLVPLLGNAPPPASAWRHNVLIEHWQADVYTHHPDYRAVWTGKYLYAEYGTMERELYDLQADPYQLQSLHLSADRALLSRLSELDAALANCRGASCRALEDIAYFVPSADPDSTLFWGDLYHNAPTYDPHLELVPGGTCTFRCVTSGGNLKVSILVAKNDLTSAYVRYGSSPIVSLAMTRERDVTTSVHGEPSRPYSVWGATIPANMTYDFVVNDGCTSVVLRASNGTYQNPLGQWLQDIDSSGGVRYSTDAANSVSLPETAEDVSVNPDLYFNEAVSSVPALGASVYLPSLQSATEHSESIEQEDSNGEFAGPAEANGVNSSFGPESSDVELDLVIPQEIDAQEPMLDDIDPDLITDQVVESEEVSWGDASWISAALPPADIESLSSPVEIASITADGATMGTNLLFNSSFEVDADNDGKPDHWSRDAHATRSASVVHEGGFAIAHRSTSQHGYVISQIVPNLTSGLIYQVGGWVNIPTSSDTKLGLELEVRWRNVSGGAISSSRVKMYRAATAGWDYAVAQLLAPEGTTAGEVRMVISNLGSAMYVDQLSFQLVNMMSNAGFELQPGNLEHPAGWTNNLRVSCSDRVVHGGRYAMRHSPLQDASYTLSQDITNVAGSTRYQVAAWVQIPPTQDTFQFQLQVRWRDANQVLIDTITLHTFSKPTTGWELASASLLSPAGTASAQVLMVASNLKATVYVDDIVFQPGNLLINGNLELDSNNDTRPDGWTTHNSVSRSNTSVRSGKYAMQHHSTTNTGYTISQDVALIANARAYSFDARVNIPATPDAFTFDLQVRWRNSAGATIETTSVKRYSAATSGWNLATAILTPPANAVTAQLLMVATSLNATIFVDDITFQIGNLLTNGSFEKDSNSDTSPDGWTSDTHVTRSNTMAHDGQYSMAHRATNEASYVVSQDVSQIVSEKAYNLVCDVNAPATSDIFNLTLRIRWLNGASVRGTSTIATVSGATNSWLTIRRTTVAPVGVNAARIEMAVNGLSTTLYVDGCSFRP